MLYLTVVGRNVQRGADASPRSCTFPAASTQGPKDSSTPARGRKPVLRDELAAVVVKQQYAPERLRF
ncbi:MAG: hypothetical protein JXA30_06725 [Deltaproteobacteria bacterium]|nr:hypothetical protein [Deltaproteobacteria bacterium]